MSKLIFPILIAFTFAFISRTYAQSPNNTATNLTVSTLTTGTLLDVTPTVSPDGLYVNLNINATFSALDGIDTFSIPFNPGPTVSPSLLRLDQVTALPNAPLVLNDPRRQQFSYPLPPLTNQNPSTLLLYTAPPPGITFLEKDRKPLLTPVPALTINLPLSTAINNLATLTNQNIVLGIAALKKENVDLTTPLHLHLPASALKSTLANLLLSAAPNSALVITTDDNVIYITTLAQSDHNIETKTYYAEDLAANSPKWLPKYFDPHTHELRPSPPADPLHIMRTITTNIRPEIWESNGGKIATMYQIQNRITIKAPQTVQALLDGPKTYNPNAAPLYINYQYQN